MTDLKELHFFATPEHDCSYIEGYKAKTLFVDPQSDVSDSAYSQLSDLGFRRSGKHIYRPHCDHCQACISVRIPLTHFKPSKSHRRIINKNKDLRIEIKAPYYSDELFKLYQRYINERHHDGDMFPPSEEQFVGFLVESNQTSEFVEFYLEDQLIAVAVVDVLQQGLSATYTFYDPSEALNKRSLGSYAILWQLQACESRQLPYLYLGYWVQACRKMSYKVNYRPLEFLIDGRWILIR
ncbi:arginyltransferase [Neptunomonas marina]|uniref:Aspartate/glutamate leucyltransferase n=1 Tax=Neptunomonas marina TaxID=1815562 RepID=A0A437QED1_9GAMM|nr:arginyltransferase [Neptunomonas marina]RVU32918.1 arginyltransferase [Neptunomonas marina]